MFRLIPIFLFLSINCFSQETQKRILFRGDSVWYAGENQILFSSADKGASWDTIFAKRNPTDTVFFYDILDTASNVFIADQRTLFVFGWDGTMLKKTILYSTSNGGKTWSKNSFYSSTGVLGVKYLHKNASGDYFLYKRRGYYAYSTDSGKTWEERSIATTKFGCFDEHVVIKADGEMIIGFSRDKECKTRTMMHSLDGGKTWSRMDSSKSAD